MSDYATVDDVISLGRKITSEEQTKVEQLLPIVSAIIRERAEREGKDMDVMIDEDISLGEIAKEVTVRAVLRTINASTKSEPATQITESAGGYSQSFTPLIPGGGVFIRKSEWQMLGLGRQQVRNLELI